MRTFIPTNFEQFSTSSASVRNLAEKALGLPTRLLRAPVEALNRQRKQALARAEFAALDSHLLADIGLRRAPIGQLRPVNTPCG